MECHTSRMKSTFETLEIWKQGRDLRNKISILCKRFPKNERFQLTDQMVRASRSVTANIAEGHGRFHYKENIQFCRQARGSLYELIDHVYVALDEGYIQQSELDDYKNTLEHLIKMINGYIKFLTSKKN